MSSSEAAAEMEPGLAWVLATGSAATDNDAAAGVLGLLANVVQSRGLEAGSLLVKRLCSARSRGGVDRGAALSAELTAAEAGALVDVLQDLEASDVMAIRGGLNLAGALLESALGLAGIRL